MINPALPDRLTITIEGRKSPEPILRLVIPCEDPKCSEDFHIEKHVGCKAIAEVLQKYVTYFFARTETEGSA